MNFRDSGLPEHHLVEDAFRYSQDFTKVMYKEAHKLFSDEINMMHQSQLMVLEAMRAQGDMTAEEFEREKEKVGKIRDAQLRAGGPMLQKELDGSFAAMRVQPACILHTHSGNAAPEMLAAALLAGCVRSPVDHARVCARFGDAVGALVAELAHLEAYPEDRVDNLSAASPDVRRLHMSLTAANIIRVTEEAEKVVRTMPGRKAMFPPGMEEKVYRDVAAAWGVDKKLDAHVAEVFNRACVLTSSAYRFEVGADGALELVRGVKPTPRLTGPKPPNKPPFDGTGSMGGDVF